MPKNQTKRTAPRRPARNTSYEIVTDRGRRLYVPHRSRHVPTEVWVDFKRAVPEPWKDMARDKGFRIDRRVRDRMHLALECRDCGALTAHKFSRSARHNPAAAAAPKQIGWRAPRRLA